MAVDYAAKGTLRSVMYFENYRGVISIPGTKADALRMKPAMEKRGFHLCEATTLRQIDELTKRIQQQERDRIEGRLEREENLMRQGRQEIRDRLVARRNSSSCSQFEREFIDAWLIRRDEKHDAHLKRERAVTHYFEERENEGGHYTLDAINNIPDSNETACVKCGRNRKVQGFDLCGICGGLA